MALFSTTPEEQLRLLEGNYEPALVLLSAGIAILVSWLCLRLIGSAQTDSSSLSRHAASLSGSIILGGGAWLVHTTSLFALSLPLPATYAPLIAFLAVLPAVFSAGLVLVLFNHHKPPELRRILLSGLLLGAGISATHYIYVAAMHVGAAIRLNPITVAISVLLAISLSCLALWLYSRGWGNQHAGYRKSASLLTAATCLGSAILAMHYTGMRAMSFIALEDISNTVTDFPPLLNLPQRITVGLVLSAATLIALSGLLRYRDLYNRLQNSESSRRNRDQQYHSLIASIPGVSFRCLPNENRDMLFISDAVLDVTGYMASEFLDGHRGFSEVIHPDDRQQVFKDIMGNQHPSNKYLLCYRTIHRDNSERWVHESGHIIYHSNGTPKWIDGVITDITQNQIRNAEFESTIKAINQAAIVIEFNLEGHIAHANQNAEILLGWQNQVLRSKNWTTIFNRENLPENFWKTLCEGDFHAGEFCLQGRGGECWVQALIDPILSPDGKPMKIVMFATDETERHRIVEALESAKYQAEQAAESKSIFLANIGHEIRTPMNSIIGFSELMLDTPLNEQQYRHINTIHQSARTLMVLLNDLLDSAKLEQASIELEPDNFSLRRLCTELIQILQLQADRKHIDLHLKYQSHQDWYQGDPMRIRQILMNLLSNAVKFTEKGYVTLQVSSHSRGVEIRIEDTGIGIAEDRLEYIFSPFTQADPSMSRRFGGTGLGTTIARQLTELMQGELTASSTLGEGSVFTVRLPLPTGTCTTFEEEGHYPPTTRKRVLAIDDLEENLELMQILLTRHGYDVDLARGGEEGVKRFQTASRNAGYDVVLMDVQMPEVDGLAATRRIRAYEARHSQMPVPIIALTASTPGDEWQRACEAGMDAFVGKPLEWTQLSNALQQLLGSCAKLYTSPSEALIPTSLGNHAALEHQPVTTDRQQINWKNALKRWGDKDVYLTTLRGFLTETWQDFLVPLKLTLRKPPAPLQQSELTKAKTLLHKLRGAAATLSLDQLNHACNVLEQDVSLSMKAISQDDRLPVSQQQKLWKGLEPITAALDTLSTLLPEEASGKTATAVVNGASGQTQLAGTGSELQMLITQLKRGEVPARVRQALLMYMQPAQISRLQQALDNFDIDQAVSLLEDLQRQFAQDEPHVQSQP